MINAWIEVRINAAQNSLVLVLAEFGLIAVGLVHPAWSKDGCREVVPPDDFKCLKMNKTKKMHTVNNLLVIN